MYLLLGHTYRLSSAKPSFLCNGELGRHMALYLVRRRPRMVNFLESGHVKVDQQKKSYDFTIKGVKTFASANDLSRISRPLQSRFRKLFLPRYTEEQFLNVSEKVLPKLSPGVARYIGNAVWNNQGDIRDVISVGKLVRKSDGPEQINLIVKTLAKYGQEGQEK